MAFPGFSFDEWGPDTFYEGDGGWSSPFGGVGAAAPPSMLPPRPQRRPLSVEDLYQPAPQAETIPMPQPAAGMGDLSPEQRKQLRNDLILQVGMALAQGAQNRGPGMAAALGEAAANARAGREDMLARANAGRQAEYERAIAEATARREQAQAEAAEARRRQETGAVVGMANKIAEAEPQAAELADTYARLGQMDDLIKLYQELPKYAAARAAGFDPFKQPNWEALLAEKKKREEEEAKRAAEFEDWKRKQGIEQSMSREDLEWRQQHGLLFAPPGPREERRPRYNIEVRDGWTYRVDLDTGQAVKLEGVPRQPPKPEEQGQKLPRIIQQGLEGEKFYEVIDPATGQPTGLKPVFPKEEEKSKKHWWSSSSLEEPRLAPTEGSGQVRPAADRGEGAAPQKAPSPEQIEKKLSLVRQFYGALTDEQEEFIRQELRKGQTAQAVLARIRMAMSGGPRV